MLRNELTIAYNMLDMLQTMHKEILSLKYNELLTIWNNSNNVQELETSLQELINKLNYNADSFTETLDNPKPHNLYDLRGGCTLAYVWTVEDKGIQYPQDVYKITALELLHQAEQLLAYKQYNINADINDGYRPENKEVIPISACSLSLQLQLN